MSQGRIMQRLFGFQPRWKEELVVSEPGGSFVLEMPMGVLSVYLPTEVAWRWIAPAWAIDWWPSLKEELEIWCRDNKAQFFIGPTGDAYPADWRDATSG